MTEQTPELAAVVAAAEAHQAARLQLAETRNGLHQSIREAVNAGVPSATVATAAGVTRARVSQLAPVPSTSQTRIHAQKHGDAPVCDEDSVTVPTIPDTPNGTLSGAVTQRVAGARYARATMFHDTRATTDLRVILDAALDAEAGRVLLVGPPPQVERPESTKAEAVREWALQPVEGWTLTHSYLNDPDTPSLTFRHDGRDHRVVLGRAAAWWGESDADTVTAMTAWRGLESLLDSIRPFAGCGLADNPSVTGRALWLRTIPEGKGYPIMCDELRELIASTSGQGRRELRPIPERWRIGLTPTDVPDDFTYVDGRFMYAALTWGLPVGEPKRWTGAQVDALSAVEYERVVRGRGRWRITATVPETWAHVGLLMAPSEAGTWHYPARPGQTFTTWADGAELWLALTNGWPVVVHEGITWDEGKPLDTWRNHLVAAWESANQSDQPAAKLAAKAIRSILLYAVGAFAARSHTETRTAPINSDPDVPPGTPVRVVGDALVWQETVPPSSWAASMAHPEWSATIWARARVRLLDGAGVGGQRTGALHLNPARVVAFSTDALYLAGDPEWADDGKPGRFRVKGTIPGSFDWPDSYLDLFALRDRAEQQ